MYFVTMTDKFMSGWGLAEGKINKMIVRCDTLAQADRIQRNAKRRGEMRRVNICVNKPRYGNHVFISWKKFADLSGPWLD
jgi:hypothetical protein